MNVRLKFPADTAELGGMRHAAREFFDAAGVAEMEAELMVLALDEACTNIIRYAYGGCCDRTIRLSLDRNRSGIRCVLRDYGATCDVSKIHGRDLADFRPGGLGVKIMSCAFDSVAYEPMARGTRLTMIKTMRHDGRLDTSAEAVGARES